MDIHNFTQIYNYTCMETKPKLRKLSNVMLCVDYYTQNAQNIGIAVSRKNQTPPFGHAQNKYPSLTKGTPTVPQGQFMAPKGSSQGKVGWFHLGFIPGESLQPVELWVRFAYCASGCSHTDQLHFWQIGPEELSGHLRDGWEAGQQIQISMGIKELLFQ